MKNKKPVLFIGLLVVLFLAIGVTLAYYTTTDTFNNEFNTGNYSIQTQEAFVSPDNWTPGTTTTKTVIATNKGNTPAAVRIKLTPSWIDVNGDPLPLTDGTNEAAIINYAFDKDYKWIYQDGYYYYIRPLNENESTSTLIDSVTFNPTVTFDKTRDCDTVNGVTTCTTTFNDYAGGKYTLKIEVETAQYDKYKEIWNTNVEVSEPNNVLDGTLMIVDSPSATSSVFGKTMSRGSFEKVIVLDVINIPNNAIDSWDCSNEQNESVMCWYIDADNNSKYELYIGQEGGVKANSNFRDALSFFSQAYYLDVTYLDTSNVTDMTNVFYYTGYTGGPRQDLFTIKGLEKWDVSKVTDMSYAFRYTGRSMNNWDIGDISGWDTSSVTNMKCMFHYAAYYAKKIDIGNIGNWNVSNVEDMNGLFTYFGPDARKWYVGDLSNWDTSSVTNMSSMFLNAGTYDTNKNIGGLKIYADNISSIFNRFGGFSATINIYSNPTSYSSAFDSTAYYATSNVVVNYRSTTTNIDAIIATKSSNSNVVKGSVISN